LRIIADWPPSHTCQMRPWGFLSVPCQSCSILFPRISRHIAKTFIGTCKSVGENGSASKMEYFNADTKPLARCRRFCGLSTLKLNRGYGNHCCGPVLFGFYPATGVKPSDYEGRKIDYLFERVARLAWAKMLQEFDSLDIEFVPPTLASKDFRIIAAILMRTASMESESGGSISI